MKKEERRVYNDLKKNVTPSTIYCEIPTAWTHEARQAIHELLTTVHGMRAVRTCPNVITHESVVLYARGHDAKQEGADIDNVTATLPTSCYCWNGYKPA